MIVWRGELTTIVRRAIALLVIVVLQVGSATAQSSNAESIKSQVAKIGVMGTITVFMPGGGEYYGNIRQVNANDFTVNEVDLHREVTLRYADVKKIRRGYGVVGRTITGKRVHPRKRLITTLLFVGGLFTFVVIAVNNDKS